MLYIYVSLFRAIILYCWRFKKCGSAVTFGHLNRIIGYRYIEIGSNTSFGNNLCLEAVDKYGRSNYTPSIKIGNGVVINQDFHCTCAESVEIDDETSITANCGVFDIIHPYEDIKVNPRDVALQTNPIKIGKDCSIGMNTVILPGTQIGNHCIVGAHSTVSGTFPDYSVIVGSLAKIIKKYNFELEKWIKV